MPHASRRVLVLGLHYPPEPTGNSPYTGAMATGLTRRNIKTRAITAHPHYPDWTITPGYGQWSRRERIDGVNVLRLRHYVPKSPSAARRVISELTFGIRLAFTRWGTPDAIVAVSPALLATWVAILRSRVTHRSVPVIVWVQDLYSLGLIETGQGGSIVLRLMQMVEGWVLRRATRVVVIHDRFARRVSRDFGIKSSRVEVVRNWTHIGSAPNVDVAATRRARGWRDDETIVLHAGNMGVKQGLANVVEAGRIADARGARVRFVLLGGGNELDALRTRATGVESVEFIRALPDVEFAAAMQGADILLVNERAGVAEMAVPSKLTSYFSSGRPVLAATDERGITAEELRAADAGVVVPAGEPSALLDAALELAADPREAKRLGANGKRYRGTVLDEDLALNRFAEIIADVIAERATSTTQRGSAHAEPNERSRP